MSSDELPRDPWDPGLQLERTALAWLRTTLSFTVGTFVLVRVVAQTAPAFAIACGCALVPPAAAIAVVSWRRYRAGQRLLHSGIPLPGGGLPVAATVLALLAGLLGMFYVLA